MGWNSWDSYGLTIDEAEFRANAQVLSRTLLPLGYNLAVIDEGWYLANPADRPTPEKLQYRIDGFGRLIPVASRFPSSITPDGGASFRKLATDLHAQGLRFGIHILRGIPRTSVAANTPIADSAFHAVDAAKQDDACPWDPSNWGVRDNAAGQAWYDALMRQYARWTVDFIKIDCIAAHPYRPDEIRMIRRAIDRSGRRMTVSLSPGPAALSDAAELGQLAQMWRISNDIWDFWQTGKDYPRGIGSQFEAAAAWARYAKPGNWPDADMLPVGQLAPRPPIDRARATRLTHDEQRTLMTLWAMMRSPFILGANLATLDPWTRALVGNRDVIAINQHSHGGREIEHNGDLIVWRAEGSSGRSYLALFNTGEREIRVRRPSSVFGYGVGDHRGLGAIDLWNRIPRMLRSEVNVTLAPHGCLLLRVGRVGK